MFPNGEEQGTEDNGRGGEDDAGDGEKVEMKK